MTENPYRPPSAEATESGTPTEEEAANGNEVSDSRAAYNLVSDTLTGVNFRGSDNWFQAKCVVGFILGFASVGTTLAVLNASWELPWQGGAMIGGFVGLLVGFLVSGIILMIYRAGRHIKGRHD